MDPRRRGRVAGNRIGVWMYRRWNGRGMGGTHEAPVVMLTVVGRRSGVEHSTCVRALRDGDGWLVWGTGSGSPTDPQWFRNLRAAGRGRAQVGSRRLRVRLVELTGAERDAAWNRVLSALPSVARYERKAGRTIPVARALPAGEPAAPGSG
jgi:deazaflavin-dependent oxidoreductase (nitroreductase family)